MLFRTAHHQEPQREPLVVEAADQKYKQTNRVIYLGGVIDENANINAEIERRTRFAWARFKRYGRQLYDRPTAPLQLKVRMLKAEVLETLLYGCMTWTLGQEHYAKLRTVHHQLLLRTISFSRRQRSDLVLSYSKALKQTHCDSVETVFHKRRQSFAGAVAKKHKGRLPRQVMSGRFPGGRNRSQAGHRRCG